MTHSTRLAAAILLCPLATSLAQGTPPAATPRDSAFEAMQERGKTAMGVDQFTSVHVFDALPNGGRIELQRAVDDSAGIRAIRTHLRSIAATFRAGDFSTPAFVHMTSVPGATVMADRRDAIRYDYRDLSRGGALRITTGDQVARRAIWQFIAFQRNEHMANGMEIDHHHE